MYQRTGVVALKSLLTDRLFAAGLLLRLAAVLLLTPYAQEAWFIPFIRNFLEHPGIEDRKSVV
jgi:hypothetical protein